jgi:S-(hydroxymethyl)glutathione dehydrogenase/alcohol dehydrogenase
LQPKPAVYDWNGKATNAGPITTFQRLSVVAENRLTVVPADTDFELCCLLADTLTTGFGTITNDARVRIGESVVIIGCGGIGLGAVLGASLAGACPVIAVDIVDHKLEKAKQYGATHTINSKTTDFRAAAEEILKGKADVVIDGTGSPGVLQEALALTAPKGRCVGIGVMPYDRTISINTLQFHFGKELTGSEGGSSLPAIDIPRQLRMIQHGRFDPKGMVSHRLKLEDVNDGIARMRSGETIHSIIHL